MNTQQYADEHAEVGSVGGRNGKQNAFICPEYTLYTSHEQGNSGGNIALLIREGRSARGYLMRCRCESRPMQIEWGMGGNNATDCEEYPQIYAA